MSKFAATGQVYKTWLVTSNKQQIKKKKKKTWQKPFEMTAIMVEKSTAPFAPLQRGYKSATLKEFSKEKSPERFQLGMQF